MNHTYFIGDLHFGHNNILKYSDKTRGHFKDIKDHDECIVELINDHVRKKDTLWILGDVAFGLENLKYIRFINCEKINLVMGNHDNFRIMDYVEAGFNRFGGAVEYKEFILTHIPVHPAQLENRYKYNIHGHLHASNISDDRYINVNADMINLIPKTLEQIRYEINEKQFNKRN